MFSKRSGIFVHNNVTV